MTERERGNREGKGRRKDHGYESVEKKKIEGKIIEEGTTRKNKK